MTAETRTDLRGATGLRLPARRVTEASAVGMAGCLIAAVILMLWSATAIFSHGLDLWGALAPRLSSRLPMPEGLARVGLNVAAGLLWLLTGAVITFAAAAALRLLLPSVKVELDQSGVRLRRGERIFESIDWSRPFTVARSCHIEPRVPRWWQRARPHLVLELRQGGEPLFLWRAARPEERDAVYALPHWGDEIPPMRGYLGEDEKARRIMDEILRRAETTAA